jgi:hypothetical protein
LTASSNRRWSSASVSRWGVCVAIFFHHLVGVCV